MINLLMMNKTVLFFFLFFPVSEISAQTYSWSGYTTGSTSYTTGILTATVTSSAPGFQNSTPRYYSGASVGSGQCGIAGGLALEHMFGNITSAHATLTLNFTSGNTTNGTCASMQFQIMDINADESFQTFRDVVQISAIDGNNTAIPVANITTSGGSNKSISTSGGTTRIISGSSGSYGSRSQTACDLVTVTVTPPVGTPLKSITIRYQPSYEACANCYYNFTGPNRPAYQYISISPITATATTGCLVLPVELRSFSGKCESNEKTLQWETFTETHNDYFILEGSSDNTDFFPIQKIDGAGNSHTIHYYETSIENGEFIYFRLRQIDFDGETTFSEVIHLECDPELDFSIYPNPTADILYLSGQNNDKVLAWVIYDVTGKLLLKGEVNPQNVHESQIDVADLPKGMYYFLISDAGNLKKEMKWVKE